MRANKMFQVGTIHKSKKNGSYKVVKYTSASNIKIRFIKTGYELSTTAGALKVGNVKDKLLPSVYGVGFLGDGKYNSTTGNDKANVAIIYPRWTAMLAKCYSENGATSYQAFGAKGVRVCTEWLNFQNFAEWVEKLVPKGSKFSLTLNDGEKVFSPDNVTIKITHTTELAGDK